VQIVEQYKKNSDLIWNFVLTRFLNKNCTDKKMQEALLFHFTWISLDDMGKILIKFFNILILLYSGMVNRAGIAGDMC
jgi:hypothetical protein